MPERLRVGMVGCGEAVQSLHMPALNSLAKKFRITACCEVSRKVCGDIASRTGSRAFSDPFALIRDPDVDVVLVTTPDAYHADVAAAKRPVDLSEEIPQDRIPIELLEP